MVYNQWSYGNGCPASLAKTILPSCQPRTAAPLPRNVSRLAGPPRADTRYTSEWPSSRPVKASHAPSAENQGCVTAPRLAVKRRAIPPSPGPARGRLWRQRQCRPHGSSETGNTLFARPSFPLSARTLPCRRHLYKAPSGHDRWIRSCVCGRLVLVVLSPNNKADPHQDGSLDSDRPAMRRPRIIPPNSRRRNRISLGRLYNCFRTWANLAVTPQIKVGLSSAVSRPQTAFHFQV